MKGLSLTQPYATLSAIGAKKIETRSWPTKFRGQFALHAAKGFPGWAKELVLSNPWFANALHAYGHVAPCLPTGSILAVAELVMCLPTNGSYFHFEATDITLEKGEMVSSHSQAINYQRPAEDTPEFHFGDYSENRFMFFMANVRMLPEPIPCKGALGFWEVPEDIATVISKQIGERC